MMNTIEYVPILQGLLDNLTAQRATSGWMTENAGRIKYNGGNEIKIPTRSLSGLGDYGRADGETNGAYPKGNAKLTWTTYGLTMDRGAEFHLDRHDDDETNFNLDLTDIVTQFVKAHVAPELDAYRYSKLSKAGKIVESTITQENIIPLLLKDINSIGQEIDTMENLIIPMSWDVYEILQNVKFNKGQTSIVSKDGMELTMDTFNGIPFYPVSTNRMKTEYTFDPVDGFMAKATAKDINWLVVDKTLPIAINKTDSLKFFDANTYQNGDDNVLQYRLYHDLIVPETGASQRLIANIKE